MRRFLPTAIGGRRFLPTAIGGRRFLPTAIGGRRYRSTAFGVRRLRSTAFGGRRFFLGLHCCLLLFCCTALKAAAATTALVRPPPRPEEISYSYTLSAAITPEELRHENPTWVSPVAHAELMKLPSHSTDVWLKFSLPPMRAEASAIFLPLIRDKCALFVADKLIYQFGQLADPQERAYLGEPGHIIDLSPGDTGKVFYLHVQSRLGRLAIDLPLVFGSHIDIAKHLVEDDIPTFVSCALTLFVGVVALLVYALNLQFVILRPFGFFCLGYSVYLFCHTRTLQFTTTSPLAWDHLQYALTFMTPAAFIEFAERLTGRFRFMPGRILRWFFVFLALTAQLLSVLQILELPVSLTLFQAVAGLGAALLLAEVVLGFTSYATSAQIFSIGVFFVCIAGLNDILVARRMLPWLGDISYLCIPAFIVTLSIVVAHSLKAAQKKHFIDERELLMAAALQEKIMPVKTLETADFALHIYAQAASRVGGDWYDYRIIDNRYLHVHVGDVTGHGTDAALLAAFAKGAVAMCYEQQLHQGPSPSLLVNLQEQLNRALWSIGSGKFSMTVVSIAIDLSTGAVEQISSGHPPIFIVEAEAKKPVAKRTCTFTLPLGLSQTLTARKPASHQLRRHDTLLLATDGVFEALNSTNSNHVGLDLLMRRFIAELADHEPVTVCNALGAVVQNGQSRATGLQDDVTFICIKMLGAKFDQPDVQTVSA